jgi:hypothetical protein
LKFTAGELFGRVSAIALSRSYRDSRAFHTDRDGSKPSIELGVRRVIPHQVVRGQVVHDPTQRSVDIVGVDHGRAVCVSGKKSQRILTMAKIGGVLDRRWRLLGADRRIKHHKAASVHGIKSDVASIGSLRESLQSEVVIERSQRHPIGLALHARCSLQLSFV